MKIYKNKFADFEYKTLYITDKKEAQKLISKLPFDCLYGLDIETAKLTKWKEHPQAGLCPLLSKIRLLQVYHPGGNVYVFDLFHIPLAVLKTFLQKGRFVAHNGVFEIKHLTHAGLPNLNIGCSMLLSQLVDGAEHSPFEIPLPTDEEEDDEDKDGLAQYRRRGHNLDAVIQRLLGYKVQKAMQVSDWGKKNLDTEQITYAGLDAVLTYKAAKILAAKILNYKMTKAYQLLKDMQHVVANMELKGLPVDWNYHKELISKWTKKSEEALTACKPFFGNTNMRSGKQMSEWLKKYLKDDEMELAIWPKTKKGAYAFSRTAIGSFTHLPAIAALLEYKKWAKLIDTYGESLIEKKHPLTGRLHTSYTIGETRTGRLSSRNPNCQNYPRDPEFRNMFMAEKDHVLVVSDFSQIELRLQAEFSKDPVMLKCYRDREDIYCTMATSLYNRPITKKDKDERFVGKTTMLALGYGMGPTKFQMYAANAGVKKPAAFFGKAHKTYHGMFRTYSLWCDKMRDRTAKLGYIETLMGKRRKLTDTELYTRAPNTVIQGSAAELMMKAMLICHEKIKGVGEIVATVHDEILIHVHKKHAETAKTVLADAMNNAMLTMFPKAVSHEVAEAAFAPRWGEAKAEL